MSQHDFDIANQSAPTFRSDLNTALKALASTSSGAAAPTTTYGNMLWYDTANNALKIRNEADSGWIIVAYFDTGGGKVRAVAGLEVWDGAAVKGILDVFNDSVWTTGTNTEKRLVSPAQVKAAIDVAQGGLTFISSTDLSNDAGAEFTGFNASLYDSYLFALSNVIPSTDNAILYMRTSSNGGASFDSGVSDYLRSSFYQQSSTPVGDGGTVSQLSLSVIGVGNAAGEEGCSGEVTILGPHLTKKTRIQSHLGYLSSLGVATQALLSGERRASEDVDAVSFFFSSGNLSSGTITMYGRSNA